MKGDGKVGWESFHSRSHTDHFVAGALGLLIFTFSNSGLLFFHIVGCGYPSLTHSLSAERNIFLPVILNFDLSPSPVSLH